MNERKLDDRHLIYNEAYRIRTFVVRVELTKKKREAIALDRRHTYNKGYNQRDEVSSAVNITTETQIVCGAITH